jgi:hypothetical protein
MSLREGSFSERRGAVRLQAASELRDSSKSTRPWNALNRIVPPERRGDAGVEPNSKFGAVYDNGRAEQTPK